MPTLNLGRVAVVPKGDWSAGSYKKLDVVRYSGASYIANKDTTETPSLSAVDWDLMAQDGAGGDVTLTGTQTLTNKTLEGSVVKAPKYTRDNDGSITGGTWAIDYNNGPLIKATVGAAITSITLSNLPASGTLGHLKLMLVNPGAYAITFPAAWKFIKSDFTTTNFAGLGVTLPASGVVFFDLITDDAGTNVYVTISRN